MAFRVTGDAVLCPKIGNQLFEELCSPVSVIRVMLK
jgi:hypothetical protein